MSFIGIMALPMTMNLLGGLFKPKPPTFNPTYFSSMSQTMSKHSADMQKMWEKPPETKKFTFDFKVPDMPEQTAVKFEQIQQKHEGERMTFLNKMQNERAEMKEQFFAKNHYETKPGPDGKPRVVCDAQGKPIIKPGPEDSSQKMARQTFEVTQKAEMFAKHASEKQEFIQTQKTEMVTFLDANKFQLHNPGIQGELQRVVMDSQKKGLKLQEKHEEEFYKIDIPPVDEMYAKVEQDLAQYREMQTAQMEIEENSPEARELAAYQQDLVALLDAKREEAREQKKAELFLQDPRKFIKNPSREDLATVLPMNLVAALEQFGITELPA